jgi:hypothetical protein
MSTSYSNYNYFEIKTGNIAASGNIMFLMDKTGELKNLERYDSCYCNLFDGCTELTQAPELPATILGNNCYKYMFSGCTSLIKAPELPATTLTNSCYASMFQGCKALTTSPKLNATVLAPSCY